MERKDSNESGGEEHKDTQSTFIPIKNLGKNLSKIVNKKNPAKSRDKGTGEESDQSDAESSAEQETDEIVKSVKDQAKMKGTRSEKSAKQAFKALRTQSEEAGEFSIFNVEEYIDNNFRGTWTYFAYFTYWLCGAFLIIAPAAAALLITKKPVPEIFVPISEQEGLSADQKLFKMSVFLVAMHATYLVLRAMFKNVVYGCVSVMKFMGVKITKDTKTGLFIVANLKNVITVFFFFFFGVVECNVFLDSYSVFQKDVDGYQRLGAYSLCLVILLGLFICEKVFLKVVVAYCGNDIFTDRIGDVNLKQCIVRRMLLYSEAFASGNTEELSRELSLEIEVTNSFLISHTDFKIVSVQNCEEIASAIFGRLETQVLTQDHIRSAFGGQSSEIWKYLTLHAGVQSEEEIKEIGYEGFLKMTKSCHLEKIDMKRTLHDRDKLLDKLDMILAGFVLAITMMIIMPAIGFDPVKYMAGLVPLIMSTGWIFSDIIKEVFKNFIFLLHEHPFDVGDRVIVSDKELMVLRIDLMYTTFTSRGGTVCYIPNVKMIDEKIYNIRRSDIQTETVTVLIKEVLASDGITNIKNKIAEMAVHKNIDEKVRVRIQDYELHDSHTKLIFRIEYLSNFQEQEPRYMRRFKPTELIQETIKDQGYTYVEQTNAYTL